MRQLSLWREGWLRWSIGECAHVGVCFVGEEKGEQPICRTYRELQIQTRQSEMADLARRATRWVGTFPYILTPIPNLYDHSFVPEIWPNNVFNLSATYDLDLWPKILKIFVSHGVPIRNMYAKFHNDRLRNGWDITLWNFAKTRTNKHTHKQTHKQTDMGITIPRPPPMGGEVIRSFWPH